MVLSKPLQAEGELPPVDAELPPVDTLTIESDFTKFMRPGVDEVQKRGALKKLFSDPRFNVMDGLDTYIDAKNARQVFEMEYRSEERRGGK